MTQRTPRRRSALAAAAATALLLTACTGGDAEEAAGPAPATDACAEAQPQVLQSGSHLIGDTEPPVPWSSDPPTSGWHTSGAGTPAGAYASPMPEADQVAVIERGGIGVVFDPDLPTEDVARLLELGPDLLEIDAVVVPHVRPLPTAVTLTAWGTLQRCDASVTAADVRAFAERHADDSDAD